MATTILDQDLADDLIAQRRSLGQDRFDEVWEGDYVMSPSPSHSHARMIFELAKIIDLEVGLATGKGEIVAQMNVSDRVEDWQHNFRVPDLFVALTEGRAISHETFWHGGPDFVVEICSPTENPHKKLDFYQSIGVREFLVVDVDRERLELFRLSDSKLNLIGEATFRGEVLKCEVIPFAFELARGSDRAKIVVQNTNSGVKYRV